MKTKLFTLLVVAFSATNLFASDTEVNGIWYDFDDTNLTASVTYKGNFYYYNEYTGSIVVPSSVTYNSKTYAVTTIGSYAFFECSGLTSITIPNSVIAIENGAFYNCRGLTSVTLSNSVTTIGDYAFFNCCGLTSVTIPNSVTTIGERAFASCRSLTSVTIPNSVTTIGDRAFDYCSGLASPVYNATIFAYMPTSYKGSYTIPDGIKQIAGGAFYNCSGLTSVTIPNSVTTIGEWAFYGCSGLTSPVYNATIFAYMPTSYKGSYTIPDGIKQIAGSAFDGCSGLTSVTIPNSVTTIGDNAFNNILNIVYFGTATGSPWGAKCVNGYVDGYFAYSDATKTKLCGCSSAAIGAITIPNSVTTIGNYAFAYCTSLTSVTIPNSVITIGDYAFASCYDLTSLTIPNSVATIGDYAFAFCIGLTSPVYNATIFARLPQKYQGVYTIPDGIKQIAGSAFEGCSRLTSVVIPNSVTEIGHAAFWGIASLTSVAIPDSVIVIGAQAFQQCSGLTSITCYAKNPPACGNDCFSGTDQSIPVYVPIVKAYKNANEWKNFTNIQFGDWCKCGDNLFWYYEKETLNIEGSGIMYDYTTATIPWAFYQDSIKQIIFSAEMTSIGECAFANCSTLTSVVIPNSVETIGESAFANCTYLTDVTIGANVKEIGCNAFAGDFRIENITCYAPITPNVCSTTFSGITKSVVYLYVPADYQRKYQVDPNWKDFDLHLIGAEQTQTGDNVTVAPSANDATFVWPSNDQADSYSLEITKDGVVFCTLKFNANGQLTGIAFAPSRGEAHTMPAATMTTNGWQFTVTGLNQASKYAYTMDVTDASQKSIKTYTGEFATDGYTDLNPLLHEGKDGIGAVKMIMNGQLYILRDNKLYNAAGVEVK